MTSAQDMGALLQQLLGGAPLTGVAWERELRRARLDCSQRSLQRLDDMLDRLRQRYAPSYQQFTENPHCRRFVHLLAFYLGEYVSRSLLLPVQWLEYGAAADRLQAQFSLPRQLFSEYVAFIGGQLFLPLGYIDDRLFDNQPASATEFVDRFIARVVFYGDANKSQLCGRFMADYIAGKPLVGGLFAEDQLRQCCLDYSLASLQQLDAALPLLRSRLSERVDWLLHPGPEGNLLLLLAFYLASTVARAGDLSMCWYERARAADSGALQPLEHRLVCRLGGREVEPLEVVAQALLGAEQQPLADFATRQLSQCRPDLPRVRPAPEPATGHVLPPAWQEVLEQAGRLAMWGLCMISDGERLSPAVLRPTVGRSASGHLHGVQMLPEGTAVQEALSLLHEEQGAWAWQVLLAEDSVDLAPAPRNALRLELRCCEPQPLQLTVVFPWCAAAGRGSFRVGWPRLLHGWPAPVPVQPLLAGMRSFRPGQRRWPHWLDEQL